MSTASYSMPSMEYAPINPQTGQKYKAQRQVGWGVQWYDPVDTEQTQQRDVTNVAAAQPAPAQVAAFDTSGYKAPAAFDGNSFNAPTAFNSGSYQLGANPFQGQMDTANQQMQDYLKMASPQYQGPGPNRFESGLSSSERRMNALLDDPSSIQQTAAYKFRLGQGQEALQRQQAAKGMLGSGNRLMELTKYGQDMASQEYENQAQRLQNLLGSYQGAWNQAQGTNVQEALGRYGTAMQGHTARGNTLASLLGGAQSAYGQARGQDLGMLQARMQSDLTARGQDTDWQKTLMQSNLTARGQDTDWQKALMQANLTARGQNIDQRGQDMTYALGGRGQDVTMRGQDLSYNATLAKLLQDQNEIPTTTTIGGARLMRGGGTGTFL